jgi:hypothetical protein
MSNLTNLCLCKRRTTRLSNGGASALSLHLLILLALLSSGCGGSGNHPLGSTAPSPQTPPFNTSEGEGNLVGTPSVLTYATVTSSAQTGLDTFYSQTVCPSELSLQNCSTNQASLNTAQFGDFNLNNNPIANNALGIKQVDAVKVDYTAINIDQTPVTVSGGIAVPQIAPAQIKGLILYFHGTTTQRTNVPSEFAPISPNSSYTDGTLLAAVWASQGYIVVMPDYIGLGDDTTHAHPYVVYPNQNAQSGLAMVLAARTLLAKSYQVNGALPLFITGYSEGGAYALEAGHLMQNNSGYASQLNVQLKKVAPMSGFFDLSGTGLAYLFYNISNSDNPWFSLDPQTSELSKPFLTAYLVLSFAQYAGISPTAMLASPFYTTNSVCLDTLSDNLSEIYFTDTQFPDYDAAVLAAADCQASGTGWSSGPTNYSNAITPLLTPTYATALMQKNTQNVLYEQVAQSDTYRFVPQFPVTLISLAQDSVVTRINSDVAFTYFTAENPGGPYQEFLVPNSSFFTLDLAGYGVAVDHTKEVPFLSVLALNQFNGSQ